jgi:hypothetical protein
MFDVYFCFVDMNISVHTTVCYHIS